MRKIHFKLLGLGAVVAVILYMLACAGNGNNPVMNPAGGNNVAIVDNAFSPVTMTIMAGTTVMWRNNGNNQHTVTSGTPSSNAGAIFDSGILGNGATFQQTFNNPGTFQYFCRVHGSAMSGTIIVQ